MSRIRPGGHRTNKKGPNLSLARAWRDKSEGTIWIGNFSGPYLYVNEPVDQIYVKTGDIIEFEYEMEMV